MTPSPQPEDRTRLKRSMSPDEGEIVDDPKRHRSHQSPPTGPRNHHPHHHGDHRRHKVVYEGGGRGREWNGYSKTEHHGRGYRGQHGRGYEEVRQPSWRGDYTDVSKRYSSQQYSSGRPKESSTTASPLRSSRSRSPERPHAPAYASPSEQTRQSSLERSATPEKKQVTTLSGEYIPQSSTLMDSTSDEPVLENATVDEEALIAERRRRREAILAKYQSHASPAISNLKLESAEASPAPRSPSTKPDSHPVSRDTTPEFVEDDGKTFEFTDTERKVAEGEGPSAADYDPTDDMKLDNEKRNKRQSLGGFNAVDYDETKEAEKDILLPQETHSLPAEQATVSESQDKHDDEDDMFATPLSPRSRPVKETAKTQPVIEARKLDASLLDTWDDLEGYYVIIMGELLNGRYVVQANLGKGMFASVVRCVDKSTPGKSVAIKILRNNEVIRKAGQKELGILEKIKEADPDDRKHVIRLEGWFEHKGHLCLVFELLDLNLRDVLKRFGRDVGINLKAVRAYAQQMFVALSLLRKCNLIHADLKPDNILINENRTTLKMCDFGSATDVSDQDITPYLVSRFYRAPEVILGIPYDYAVDTWAIGCTLFELYTGKILFPGRSNNQMLLLMMDCRGRFPSKMLRRGRLTANHFTDQMVFLSHEVDSVTGKEVVKQINIQRPNKELKQRVLGAGAVSESEGSMLSHFVDFLGRCLELTPEKRITPSEAFRHPFLKI